MLSDLSGSQNIVWQTGSLSDFRQAVLPQIDEAASAGHRVVYIHFSNCEVMFENDPRIQTRTINLSHRFEAFTVDVYNVLNESGSGILYLFDALSALQTAWATDLMMENFFSVITPMIIKYDNSAFFPLLRGRHSLAACENIKKKTTGFIEIYSDFKNLYIKPLKLPDQSEADILMPYVFDEESRQFVPIRNGVLESHFRRATDLEMRKVRNHHQDSWDQFFDRVQRDYEDGRDITEDMRRMRDIMMSRDEHIRNLLDRHFAPEDYFFVKEHMVGTGLIGGKSCGMLTARKIIENCCPEIYDRLEPHDSFFIGSDVFYTYIVENGFWNMRVEQRKPEGYFALADEFADQLLHGRFSEKIEEEFISLLEYYGKSPVIVRSSSILEDGFGNAFAGKYESVFCPGCGTFEERLEEFENAVRIVYASTLSRSALDYRIRRGLDNRDEQMALLVQRVSGSYYGDYYMPCAAGVGYSYSTYRFLDSLDPKAGMLRLVMGLGTSAVDRTSGSYPRLVSLDRPEVHSYKSIEDQHKHSQRNVDLIDLADGTLKAVPLRKIEQLLPAYVKRAVLGHDTDAERRLRETGTPREVYFISCAGLVKNKEMMSDMQTILQSLQYEYDQPVDIEFTINISESGEYVINLLQCRPLQHFEDRGRQLIPEDIPDDHILADLSHATLGLSQQMDVDLILYVDPVGYYKMPYSRKSEIARCIGAVNWYFRGQDKKMLLLVPGRIGTSSPELGVATAFSDISEFSAIFEISETRAGYNPELSYGSHIFQDLVENEILYAAVFEDSRTRIFSPELLSGKPNIISDIAPGSSDYTDIVRLYDVSHDKCILYHDLLNEHLVCSIDNVTEV